jgi:hypothetical protein
MSRAPAVEAGDDRRELPAAAVLGLGERQPLRRRRLAARGELVPSARSESPLNLVAGRALAARHLGIGGPAAHPRERPPAEAPRHTLARRQLGRGFRERLTTPGTAVAALAPHQIGDPTGDRQVAHPQGPLIDVDRRVPSPRTAAGPRDQLNLEVEPVGDLNNALHLEPSRATRQLTWSCIRCVPLAPQFMTTQSLEGQRMSLRSPLTTPLQQDPRFQPVVPLVAVMLRSRVGEASGNVRRICTSLGRSWVPQLLPWRRECTRAGGA